MSEEWKAYIKDPRVVCKYGVKCYQKNPDHHKKYKHAPQRKGKDVINKRNKARFHPYSPGNTSKNDEKDNDVKAVLKITPNSIGKDQKTSSSESGVHNDIIDEPLNSDSQLKQDIDSTFELKPSGRTEAQDNDNTTNKSSVYEQDVDTSKDCMEAECNYSYYSKDTDHSIIEDLFLVEMPEDFFKFFECLTEEFQNIEQNLAHVNLQLIGPYDFLLGKLPKLICKDMYLNHWRFFYDPPEFQTVLKKKGSSQFHIGYFRDDPKEKPVFLAKNDSAKDCIITPIADNIFGAVYWYLKNEKSPFIAIACKKLMEKVKTWSAQHNYSVEEFNMKKRLMKVNCRTFHSAGIVVPYDKKTKLGYRPLVETDGKIKDMFKRLSNAKSEIEKDKVLAEIQPIITYANIAMDECDFGTGLEAGIAFFCSGSRELQTSSLKCLDVAYSLLGRDAFKKIIQIHLGRRRKGPNVSAF